MDDLPESTAALQYLTFRAGGEVYALGLLEIREIAEHGPLDPIPASSEAVLGLRNLRGEAVPILDLARILGAPPSQPDGPGCILVVDAPVGGRTVTAGLLADAVCQVIAVGPGDFQNPPLAGTPGAANYLKALARHDDRFIPVLSLEHIFAAPVLGDEKPWDTETPPALNS